MKPGSTQSLQNLSNGNHTWCLRQFPDSSLTQSEQKLVWRQDEAGATEGLLSDAFAAPFNDRAWAQTMAEDGKEEEESG